MLTEFDQKTIANMTAALDFVCKKFLRIRTAPSFEIADELIQCARSSKTLD